MATKIDYTVIVAYQTEIMKCDKLTAEEKLEIIRAANEKIEKEAAKG